MTHDAQPTIAEAGKAHRQPLPKRAFRPGAQTSILALGTSAFGEVFNACSQDDVNKVVHLALEAGVNLIDTAYWYGHGRSEERLGVALRGVPRDSYMLFSKCCRYEAKVTEMFDFSAERTLRAVDESLARLGVEYLDCMQVHDPEYAPSIDVIINETLPALQQAKDAGKIKMIGITGYPLAIHREILARSTVKIDTCLLYCHCSLNDATLLDSGFLDEAAAQGIAVVNASPISMGLLSSAGPPAWHPASAEIKQACKAAAAYCESHGLNISRLAMGFTLRQSRIPTTLVSTTDPELMKANLAVARAEGALSPAEEEALVHLRETFFKPLENPTWEGAEVAQYHDLVRRTLAGETDVGTLSTN